MICVENDSLLCDGRQRMDFVDADQNVAVADIAEKV